ncbi:PREDICTED: uncharacterized protein LOC105457591, partial [Wasmannia auropunctata]|uniref:uncharacterized protein LOC105457591 n=1 Tax=Wasmannia auropunctata TaxID=64793 RepID=UPI0005F09C72
MTTLRKDSAEEDEEIWTDSCFRRHKSFTTHLMFENKKKSLDDKSGCLNLAVCHLPISLNHFMHSINISGNNRHGWTIFTKFVAKKGASTLEFGKPIIKSYWMVLHPQKPNEDQCIVSELDYI